MSIEEIRRAQIELGVDSDTIIDRYLAGALSAPQR